jgi:heme-degrading monooxygenase HmoA
MREEKARDPDEQAFQNRGSQWLRRDGREDWSNSPPGFLGIESARDGLGITVSYWESQEAIRNRHQHAEHKLVQQKGYEIWYQSHKTRICRVERDYGFERSS